MKTRRRPSPSMEPSKRGTWTEARTLKLRADHGSETRRKRPGEGEGGARSKAVPTRPRWAATCGLEARVASSRPYVGRAIGTTTLEECRARVPAFARTSR